MYTTFNVPDGNDTSYGITAAICSAPDVVETVFLLTEGLKSLDICKISRNWPARSEEVCEICERPGHDIFTCDLLKEGAAPPSAGIMSSSSPHDDAELICEDCEERGHTAANCPHSLDVF